MPIKSAISFGLVYIPITLNTAIKNIDISFNQLHKDDKERIRYKKVCSHCGKEVKNEDILKGFEYDKDKYVVITEDEIEKIKSEKDRTIQIIHFSDIHEISPIYFDKTYQAIPQKGGEKAFELLQKAMIEENKIAIAKTVFGTSESLIAILAREEGIIIQTLYFNEEIKDWAEYKKQDTVSKEELKMATSLIANMIKPFEPEKYEDEYQNKLRELIDTKIRGQEVVMPKEQKSGNVIDLMDALKASIEGTKPKKSRKNKGA